MNDRCLAFAFATMLACASSTNAQVRLSSSTQWITVEDMRKLGKFPDPFRFAVSIDRKSDGSVSDCKLADKSQPKKLSLAICNIVKERVRYAPFPSNKKPRKPDFVGFEYSTGELSIIADSGGATRIKWFVDDSLYPAEAIRQGEQGRVRAGFIIGENGRARACHTVTSSFSKSLDALTCAQVLANFVAEPPLNEDGKPIAVPGLVTVDWVNPRALPATQRTPSR